MPTNRTRRGQPRRATMVRSDLADWVTWFGLEDDPFNMFQGDIEAIQNYWETFGDSIVAEWILKHPGTRPWAWWEWTTELSVPEDEEQSDFLLRSGFMSAEEETEMHRLEEIYRAGEYWPNGRNWHQAEDNGHPDNHVRSII
jgi:hypothetical protein